jgi:hypothetical protein
MFLSHPRLCERSHTPKALLHNTPWEKTNAHQQDYISYTKLTASKHYYKFRAACQTFSSALISMTKKNSNSPPSTQLHIQFYTTLNSSGKKGFSSLFYRPLSSQFQNRTGTGKALRTGSLVKPK